MLKNKQTIPSKFYEFCIHTWRDKVGIQNLSDFNENIPGFKSRKNTRLANFFVYLARSSTPITKKTFQA